MKIIQAPEEYNKAPDEVALFLAGGCSSTAWRKIVIRLLKENCLKNLVVYDPYNPFIESTYRQVCWEYQYLNQYVDDKFIFSAYFDKYTDQPITLYELGRASVLSQQQNLAVGKSLFTLQKGFPCVVSYKDYKKREDLICQCGLAKITCLERTPEEHAKAIIEQYDLLMGEIR